MANVDVLIIQRDRVKLQLAQTRTRLRRIVANPKRASMEELLVLSQNTDKFYEEYNDAYDGILRICEPTERCILDEDYEEFEKLFYETCVTIERLKEEVETQPETDTTRQSTSPLKPKRKNPTSSQLPLFDSKVCVIPDPIPNPSNAATNDPMDSPPSPSDDEGSQCPSRTIVDCTGHIPEALVNLLRSNPCQTVVPDNSKPLKRKPSSLPNQSEHVDTQNPITAELQQPTATSECAKLSVCDPNRAVLPISCQTHCPMNQSTSSPEARSSVTSCQDELVRIDMRRLSDISGSNLRKVRTVSTEKLGTGSEGDIASKPQPQASTEDPDCATSGSRPESRSESVVPQPYPPKIKLTIQFTGNEQDKFPVTAAHPETRSPPTTQKPPSTTSVTVKMDYPVEIAPNISQEDERAIQLRTEAMNLVMVPFQKRNPVPEYIAPSLKQKMPPDIIQAIVEPEHKTSTNQYQIRCQNWLENERQGSKKLLRPREAKWRFPPPRAPEQPMQSAKPDLYHVVLEPIPSSRTEQPQESDHLMNHLLSKQTYPEAFQSSAGGRMSGR